MTLGYDFRTAVAVLERLARTIRGPASQEENPEPPHEQTSHSLHLSLHPNTPQCTWRSRPTLSRRSPLKLSTIRQTGVISGEIHKAFKLIRQQMHSRIRPEFGSAQLFDAVRPNNRYTPIAPYSPSRDAAPKYTLNSRNRPRTEPNPYRFNSATNTLRISPGTPRRRSTPGTH